MLSELADTLIDFAGSSVFWISFHSDRCHFCPLTREFGALLGYCQSLCANLRGFFGILRQLLFFGAQLEFKLISLFLRFLHPDP